MVKEMKFATYQRSTNLIKGRFEKILAKITDLSAKAEEASLSPVQIRTLNSYLTEMRKKRADFEGNFQRIVEHGDTEEISEADLSNDVDSINDLYISVVSQIETLLPVEEPQTPTSVANASFQNVPPIAQNVRLPQLDLKSFNGDVTTWVAYINLFDATVHQNHTLSSVIKFQYLLSSLTDEPLNLIKSMNISAANYPIAYELLRDRYHNPRRLSTLHLNAILDLPNVNSGNTKGLRTFLNLFAEHTQSLQALQCDVTTASNPLLSAHLLRKLDQELRKKLELFRSTQECNIHTLPSVDHIIKFLNNECNQIEDASLHSQPTTSRFSNSGVSAKYNKGARFDNKPPSLQHPRILLSTHSAAMSHAHTASGSTSGTRSQPPHPSHTCFACNLTGHKIYSCSLFLSKTPSERSHIVKAHSRCFSCLGAHMLDKCTSKNVCNTCKNRHHSLLHFEKRSPSTPVQQQTQNSQMSQHSQNSQMAQQTNTVVASAQSEVTPSLSSNSTVLLGTALVKLTTPEGNSQVFRALLDSGSQLSFISERAAQLLCTTRIRATHTISGISATISNTKGLVTLDLTSLSDQHIATQHQFHILNRISADLPRTQLLPEVWHLTRTFVLADPTFHLPGPVDVLIGGALFPLLFTQRSYSLGPNLPHMIGTHLGFVVMGVAPCDAASPPASLFVSLHASSEPQDLHSTLQRFWTIEEPPATSRKSMEEELCDQHFITTHSRCEDGRYMVRLPFKENHPPLGTSRIAAEHRFQSLERKLQAQPSFCGLYSDFMEEYQTLGHMTKTEVSNNTSCYYLPHHGVLKEQSSTTKLRTVFDASCKTSTGVSLNDVLLTGRKLQTDICDILLHFRTHKVVFSCDIRQMYRQILVHPDDRNFQLILWRDHPSQPLSSYQLNTVTYGINSSPYLAIKTLHQLADDEGESFPAAATVLKNHSYVDDLISGANSTTEALDLQRQLINLLKRGGFELRKWSSNAPELLECLPENHLETPVFLDQSQQPHFTILGLHWSPVSDSFKYDLNLPSGPPTKRNVLSLIARIYDPCGFLSPFIMLTKCFMQLLWSTGLQWDDPLPSNLAQQWQTIVSNSQSLSNVEIPRALHLSSDTHVELHGFSDASESGYAAAVYLKCQTNSDDVIVRLILAKTRVAPLKRVTLPRLELCAAHLLSQLVHYCFSIFGNNIDYSKTYLWCDSSVALTWLQTPSYRLKTFVANRVAQTQEFVPTSCWHYIPSKENPADCASRGILAPDLVKHPLWWSGPPWLSLPPSNWPDVSFSPVDLSNSEEMKSTPLQVLVSSTSPGWNFLSKYSSWTKLLRVTAYLLRFIHNVQHPEKRHNSLTAQELRDATLRLFKLIQAESFAEDLILLKKNRTCSLRLQRLSPFLSDDGLIRVGGRLRKANLPLASKHTVILPKKHHVVSLLINYYHLTHLHAGPQLTQALLAQSVWILSARCVIRSELFKCVTCFRVKPKNVNPLMGDLPTARVTPAKPFNSVGTDFCGPFPVKIFNLKAIRHVNVYICIFICMVTKAMHLEVVNDLTTDAFIASLTRFVSRRGLCNHIFSDCGTNFVGADAALKKVVNSTIYSKDCQDKLLNFSSMKGISFHFNPPAAPHHGGLWESAVKSTKHHLRRVMGTTVLTLMEFITLTTQIEAMLNSRPLTPLSSDPSDCSALTPGHFLIGSSLAAVPEADHQEVPLNRLKHWQQVQALNQRVWKKWQMDYLHTLQQRSKWHRLTENLKIGDLVLIHNNSPPLSWPLARITAVHPGTDGVVRVVDLKTQHGHLKRPAVKVFPLPSY